MNITRRTIIMVLLALAPLSWAARSAMAQAPAELGTAITFPAFPRLIDVAALKSSQDFAAKNDAAIKAAEAQLAKPINIPSGPAGWYFDYTCPDDGAFLNAKSPREHVCPTCKKVCSDERVMAAQRGIQHNEVDQAIFTLAQGFLYSGDERFAATVKEALLRLSAEYALYPPRHDRFGKWGPEAKSGGRRFAQTIDEAISALKLARAYDMTRPAKTWTDADVARVESELFKPLAKTLTTYNQGVTHHQAVINSAILALASITGDKELAREAINGVGGFRDTVRFHRAEAIWSQGLIGHHVFAVNALIDTVEFGKRLGLKLHDDPILRRMIAAPLHIAYPDGTYPAINDGDRGNLGSLRGNAEWAWRTYQDPLFAQLAAWGDAKRLNELLPSAKPEPLVSGESEDLRDAGIAVLRRGSAEGSEDLICAMLDYGPHGGSFGGGHGHFDKLNLTLFANKHEWLVDSGRIAYTLPIYKTWVKESIAHNTVTLGGKSQAATTGSLLWLRTGDETSGRDAWTACAAESSCAYPGATLRRYLLLTDEFMIDVFDVICSDSTQIDWAMHTDADKIEPIRPTKTQAVSLGNQPGYRHLSGAVKWEGQPGARPWTLVSKDKSLIVQLIQTSGETVITATGIGHSADAKAPALIRRVEGKQARFATIYVFKGAWGQTQDVKISDDMHKPPAVTFSRAREGKLQEWSVRFALDAIAVD